MISNGVKCHALLHFEDAYETFLSEHIYKDKKMYKQLMSGMKVKRAFKDLVKTYMEELVAFYEKYPNASYMDELAFIKSNDKIRQKQQQYYSLTNDSTLIKFLQIYTYLLQEVMYDYVDEYGVLEPATINDYFRFAQNTSINMFMQLKKDIDQNNYWWLKNTASSLRRQLCDKIIVFSTRRMQALCDKYYSRRVDVETEFADEAEKGSSYVNKLVQELDDNMKRKYGATPMFCWWGVDQNGQRVLYKSKTEPAPSIYSFLAYTTTPSAERIDNQK